ncbi:hypothetical protein D3C86_2145910 [compost metagenome]
MLGLHYGLGLTGIYIAMMCDEYLRGILVAIRWRRKKYLRLAEGRTNSIDPLGATDGKVRNVHSA